IPAPILTNGTWSSGTRTPGSRVLSPSRSRTTPRQPALLSREMPLYLSITLADRAGEPGYVPAQSNSRIPNHRNLFSILGNTDCPYCGHRLGPQASHQTITFFYF